MLVNALRPARINSLFLISMPRAKARFFISPICISSVLGMVKLSRITLIFLSFKGLAVAGVCFFTGGFTAKGLAACGLAAALVGAADFLGVVVALLLTTRLVTAGSELEDCADDFWTIFMMRNFKINGVYSLYRLIQHHKS